MLPQGRSFTDFTNDDRRLSQAEQALLKACCLGEAAEIGDDRPRNKTEHNCIRSTFLRFLILGGDENAPLHEKGAYVKGAWIEGDIDLEACKITAPITLDWCHIEGKLVIRDAELKCLFLDNCFAEEIDGDRVRCIGSMHLNNGTELSGPTMLGGCEIGGDLDCIGARFQAREGENDALYCEGAEIKGSVLLGREGDERRLQTIGNVQFTGARVHGNFSLNNVGLAGSVVLIGASIRGDVDFSEGEIRGSEILLSRVEILGRLFICWLHGKIKMISLRAAKIGALVDDEQSWGIADELLLDGFEYDRIIDTEILLTSGWTQHFSSTNAADRIRWLDRQREADLLFDFKPQPWEQLIKVLRSIGHQESAKQVGIAKQIRLRRARLARSNKGTPWRRIVDFPQIVLHWFYGVLSRYGYRPSLIILWAILTMCLFAGIFRMGGALGVISPSDWQLAGDSKDDTCRPERGGNWTTCSWLRQRGYQSFDPLLFSFDLIVPIIATQQTKDWTTMTTIPCASLNRFGFCREELPKNVEAAVNGYWSLGVLFWIAARIETLIGWAFGLTFVAIVSGLVKRD
jgi:hypothetical protein